MENIIKILTNPGVLIFGAVKLLGYIFLLTKLFRDASTFRSVSAGVARSILGLVLGSLILSQSQADHAPLFTFYGVVLVIRTLEWALILRIAFPEEFRLRPVELVLITSGVSTLLDIPAVLGMISKTGLIC